jgi:PAS domain S-box-containing protein
MSRSQQPVQLPRAHPGKQNYHVEPALKKLLGEPERLLILCQGYFPHRRRHEWLAPLFANQFRYLFRAPALECQYPHASERHIQIVDICTNCVRMHNAAINFLATWCDLYFMGAHPQAAWQGFEVLVDAPIPCHELDAQGKITRINAAGCRLLGLAENQIVGRYVWEFVAPEQQLVSRERILSNLSGAYPLDLVERSWIRPDGVRLVLEIHTNQIRDARGRICGLRTFLLDVTRRKRAEAALRKVQESLENRIRERTAELELANDFLRREMEERHQAEEQRHRLEAQVQHAQRLESLGVLAGGIAHDFNNLLASIMGYASLAAMDLPESSPTRRALDQVLIAAQSAADLTQQMLAYSGRGTFVLEPLNLTQLIEGVVRLLESTIHKKAELRLRLASSLPSIQADASQIRQVVMNLITNAAESLGDKPGSVDVTTGVAWVDADRLPAADRGDPLPPGEYVYLQVADTGCGMDAKTVERIFDPFFTTKFTGRGLGLAAVLGIVRGHHGSIQVDSRPGQGTTFTVMFPAVSAGISEIPEDSSGLESWRAEGVVLVVEDQPAVQDLARTILERAGLTVLTASDGKQAVAVFTAHAQDIRAVLLDLNMPGMDGVEVLDHIKGLVPDVRVVLSSGYNEQDVTTRFESHKPGGFLRKPYHPWELLERLRAIW